MEPLTGFVLYALAAVVVGVVAGKRGRRGWLFGLGVLVAGPVAVICANLVGAGSVGAAWFGFAMPALGLLLALSVRSGEQIAAEQGSYLGLRKCPHCAESIKAEANVCKHCGRTVRAP